MLYPSNGDLINLDADHISRLAILFSLCFDGLFVLSFRNRDILVDVAQLVDTHGGCSYVIQACVPMGTSYQTEPYFT